MTSFANFAQFIRHGGQARVKLSLRNRVAILEVKQADIDDATLAAFAARLCDLADENWSYLAAALGRASVAPDPDAENVMT